MKLLPNGLIGVFIAAMLAATMSTLSSVYNMVSSILSRDIYQGWFKPEITDEGLLKVGRIFSILLGLFVTVMAVVFNNSQFGIFNWMQTFFTLLNIPVVVPIAFGLLCGGCRAGARSPSISWGLLVGVVARWFLGWDIGPQVYLAFVTSFGIFASSYILGRWYLEHKGKLVLLGAAVTALYGAIFFLNMNGGALWGDGSMDPLAAAGAAALILGGSTYLFGHLFATETDAERAVVVEFFKKLDTPVDVAKEVFGAGTEADLHVPAGGRNDHRDGPAHEPDLFHRPWFGRGHVLGAIVVIMVVFGALMWYFGKRSEIRSAAEYDRK